MRTDNSQTAMFGSVDAGFGDPSEKSFDPLNRIVAVVGFRGKDDYANPRIHGGLDYRPGGSTKVCRNAGAAASSMAGAQTVRILYPAI